MLELGVCAWAMQSNYMRPSPHQALYREALEEARFAESLGFESFWLGEHHFAYDGYCPSLIPAAAYLLAGTSNIKLGAGVLLLPLHGAARVAEASAAVNAFAPGRLRIAVAAGWRALEFAGSGLDVHQRGRLTEEYCTALVEGEQAARFRGTELWMGGISPAAIQRAGRFGASPLLTFGGPKEVAGWRTLWQEHLRPDPASPPRVGYIKDIWVDTEPARIEWVRKRMREMWRFYRDLAGAAPGTDLDPIIDMFMAPTYLGSPQAAVDALAPLVEAGVDTLVLRMRFDGIESTHVKRCMEQLATQVAPQLRRMK